jgi:AcrR family transcriptional regulator
VNIVQAVFERCSQDDLMTTEQRRRKLQGDLIDAAESAIAAGGLSALHARDLARTVGCALGAIYNVVPDLHALVFQVNSRTLAMIEGEVAASDHLEVGAAVTPSDHPATVTLARLALAYFDFAAAHTLRWRALFEHHLPDGQVMPDWHLAEHRRLFLNIETPLRAMVPNADATTCMLLARSLFSAVHGIVSLGLEEKLVPLPLLVLRQQTVTVAAAAARGLAVVPSALLRLPPATQE